MYHSKGPEDGPPGVAPAAGCRGPAVASTGCAMCRRCAAKCLCRQGPVAGHGRQRRQTPTRDTEETATQPGRTLAPPRCSTREVLITCSLPALLHHKSTTLASRSCESPDSTFCSTPSLARRPAPRAQPFILFNHNSRMLAISILTLTPSTPWIAPRPATAPPPRPQSCSPPRNSIVSSPGVRR